jgi:hypothetical protein
MNRYTQDGSLDFRLAKAFKFNIDDLLANRDGVLSSRQRGISDWLAFHILFQLRQIPFVSRWFSRSVSPKKQPRRVQSICGRIELKHYIVDQRLIRSSLFYEYYHLVLPGHNRTFHLTHEQFQALTGNWKYRIYYQELGEQRNIMSIERVIRNCDG